MIEVTVDRFFKTIPLFKWIDLVSFRKENKFLVNSKLVFLDMEKGRIVEMGGESDIVLARYHRRQPKADGAGKYVGEVSAGDLSITIAIAIGTSLVVSVNDSGETWDFTLHDYELPHGFSIDRKDFKLCADTSTSFGRKDDRNIVIRCEEEKTSMARIIGVLVCSMVYDHYLAGSYPAGGS